MIHLPGTEALGDIVTYMVSHNDLLPHGVLRIAKFDQGLFNR